MSKFLKLALFVAVSAFIVSKWLTKELSHIVEISNGKIIGNKVISRDGSEYYEFLGIPYGIPPVNELRFKPPLPAKKWDGVFEANNYGSKCIQADIFITARVLGQEDCLTVNVFTDSSNPNDDLKPVMVFIHGGLFMSGSSVEYKGKYFFTKNEDNVVLVTFNYRLGLFGFMNTKDGVVNGNNGLKDQVLAPKWIKENIKSFGGDPNKVTIFGESAGAASVHYHMISSSSKGLFNKAISQSGSCHAKWTLKRTDTAEQAKNLARNFKCPITNSEEMVKCLKGINTRDLANYQFNSMSIFRNNTFVPSIEINSPDAFLTDHPEKMLKNGKFQYIPWMIGVNSQEGLMQSGKIIADGFADLLDDNWDIFAPQLFTYDKKHTEVAKKIREFYYGKSKINPKEDEMTFGKINSDRAWFAPTAISVKNHAKFAPTYLYYFSYPPQLSAYDVFKSISGGTIPAELQIAYSIIKDLISTYILGIPVKKFGPVHADELMFLFNMNPILEIRENSKDYEMSASMIKLWKSFAYDEKNMKFNNVKWDPIVLKDKLTYMQLDTNGGLIEEPNQKSIDFWTSLNV